MHSKSTKYLINIHCINKLFMVAANKNNFVSKFLIQEAFDKILNINMVPVLLLF